MLFLLNLIRKLYKVIVSETSPLSIASGFAVGVILGLTPILGLHTFLILCAVLMLRVNLASVFASMGVFKLLGVPFWGAFHFLGFQLLGAESLSGLWTALSNTRGLNWLRLNNTQVLGSLLVSLLLAPIVFGLGVAFVRSVRRALTEDRQNHWLVKLIAKSRLLKLAVKMAK